MAAINFPDSPSNGALYSAGGKNWSYNGTAWILQGIIPVIPDGSIVDSQIASNAVTTAKIANSAVTVSKIESNPTFVGTVTLPSTTSIGNVSATEISYVDGVTSAIQTQINTKSPSASPTFTGTVVLPSDTSIGNVSSTEIGYVDGVTSAIQTQLNTKSPSASPTFTGNVALPSTTSIGTVTGTEVGYLSGITSAIQTQLNARAPLANPTFTGTVSGITKSMVGLGSVDNTADTAKPVSTAQQTALDLKANLASPNFTSGITTSGMTNNGNLNTSGNIQQNMVHGYNFRQELAPGNNGAGTGVAQLNMWISEPGATWTGAGISRNRTNSAGSFPHVNSGLSSQMIRFAETSTGGIDFTCTNTARTQESGFSFDSTGAAYKPGGGSWSAPSDIRLKDNIRDYDKGTAELMQVRVREWEHNGKGGIQEGSKGLGVVADEIELVLPDTVNTYEGKLNPEDEETTDIKSVNATEITWLLVKTVQEQQALIEQLTARIEALEV